MADTGGTSRRTFLFAMGAMVLGRFAIPESSMLGLPSLAAPDAGRHAERIRRLISTPSWDGPGHVMVWVEVDEDDEDEVRTMMWFPETDEEIADATRFYEAATWRSWKTTEDLKRLLAGDGPWLIRWNFTGTYQYLITADEDLLFGDDDAEILSSEASDAVEFTSRDAFTVITRLTKDWDLEDSDIYFEPVRPGDA